MTNKTNKKIRNKQTYSIKLAVFGEVCDLPHSHMLINIFWIRYCRLSGQHILRTRCFDVSACTVFSAVRRDSVDSVAISFKQQNQTPPIFSFIV